VLPVASKLANDYTYPSDFFCMSLKRQFMWSMAPLMIITVVNIFSVPMFYRYLGPEMYALWFYVIAFTGMFGFADLGLGVAVGRYIGVALGKGDTAAVREYWGTGNLIAIPLLALMALVFIGVGVWFGPMWFDKLKPENMKLLQWAFVFGGCGLFLSYYIQFWLVLSQAHLDFKFIGILRGCFSVAQVMLTLWLAYLTHNPVVLILSGLAVAGLQLGIFIWHANHNYELGWNFRDASLARAREMAGYTFKSFASLLAGSFLGGIDRLLLGKVAAPVLFTHYNICNNFGGRIQGLSVAIMGPVFHQTSRTLSKGGHASAAAIYNETFNFVFGWYALVAIWVAIWHPVLLQLWLGREPGLAAAIAPVFTPLVIAFCFSALANVSGAQLGPLNRMGVLFGFTVVSSLALGICVFIGWYWSRHMDFGVSFFGIVCIPEWHWDGLVGVAWGVLASRVVFIVQDLYVIRLIGGGGWLSPRTWEHLLIQCCVGLAFYFGARALAFSSPSSIQAESFWETLSVMRWQLSLALLHGGLVAAWLLRGPLLRVWKARFAK
jgi:O-antigen/teichoic acid export membrane protein